jgi:hypothetical protein
MMFEMTPEMLVIWMTPLFPAFITAFLLKTKNGKSTFSAFTFGVFIYLFMVVGAFLSIEAANRWDLPFSAMMLLLAVLVFLLFRWQAGSSKR